MTLTKVSILVLSGIALLTAASNLVPIDEKERKIQRWLGFFLALSATEVLVLLIGGFTP